MENEEVNEEGTEVVPAETAEEVVEEVVEETPQEDAEEVIVPKKKTAQERIDEITRARRDAEREKEYWRNLALKKEDKQEVETAVVSSPTRPKLDQYETVEAYEDDLLAWHERKRNAERDADLARKRTEDATRKFQENAAKLRAEIEDFDEVVESPVFTPAMRMAILNADNGPAVAYYLGKEENRLIASKIASLPVELQLYELGKLEVQLLQKTKRVPGASAPIKPVGIGGGGGGGTDTSKMNDDEWLAYERQQKLLRMKKKLGG